MNILINSLCCTAGFVYTKPRETGVSGVVCYHRPLHPVLPKDRGGRSGRGLYRLGTDGRIIQTACGRFILISIYLSLSYVCIT